MLEAGRQTLLPSGLKNKPEDRGLLHEQSLETTLPLRAIWSAPDNAGLPVAFKKQRFPPVTKRLYLPILPVSNGLNSLALAAVHMYPVSFFRTYPLEVLQIRPDQIVKTSHENLVNLEEAYLGHRSIVIAYDSYGISLEEIRRTSNIFFNDAGAVACICRELLKGLKYIHNEVGIAHGSLSCSTIILTDRGHVKISKRCCIVMKFEPKLTWHTAWKADVGDGMVRGRGIEDRTMDNRAVGEIAATLLRLDCLENGLSGIYLEAESFINVSSSATVDELLNHRFLQAGVEPWCLQSLAILSKIIRYTV